MAGLPVGMILFIVLIGLMAYYLDAHSNQVTATQDHPAQTFVR